LKENEKAKAEEAAKAAKEAAEAPEPVGVAGWVGLGAVLLLVLGSLLNFGRPAKKQKVSLNKRRGLLQQLMSKVKGG